MRKFIAFFLISAITSISLFSCSPREIPPDQMPIITPEPSLTPEPDIVEILPLDEVWSKYLNHRLGFSLKIPKQMFRADAGCQQHGSGDVIYFTPEQGLLPVVVLEGTDRVIITTKTDIILSSSSAATEKNPNPLNDQCEIIENSFQYAFDLDYTSYNWEIVLREIGSEADLESLVDAYYGECFSVGDFTPVEGKDYMRGKILGDGKPVEESKCLVRWGYQLLYSSELKIAATWHTGQSIHFSDSFMTETSYDGEMIASFEFIPRSEDS